MCTVRPSLGHEGEPQWGYYGFPRTEKIKKIIVIGGGPAGLQFASVAAKRGHDVTLYEKEERLGGSILLASKIDSGEEELLRPIDYLVGECSRVGVKIHTGHKVSHEIIKFHNPDAIVVAAGAKSKTSLNLPQDSLYTAEDIMGKGKMPPAKSIIIGGNGVGLATAVFLLRGGQYELSIIEEASRLGRDVNPFYLWRFVQILKKNKVAILTNSKISGIDKDKIIVATPKGEQSIQFDGVILAQREDRTGDFNHLKTLASEVYYIGDAKKPRRLNNAIHDGFRLGMII